MSSVTALGKQFDYSVPDRMAGRIRPGSICLVRLGPKLHRGVVVDLLDEPAVPNTRPVSRLFGDEPLFDESAIATARSVAERYVVSVGAVLGAYIPGRLTVASTTSTRPSSHMPDDSVGASDDHGDRSEDSAGATEAVGGHSETASVCIVCPPMDMPDVDGPALILAPTISLARSLARRFGAALYDASATPAARAKVWSRARGGTSPLVVGTRAALLVPVPGLRTVVVANGHDRSFKNERSPRVSTPWAARKRATHSGATYISVSPAPTLEDWFAASSTVLAQLPRKPQVVNRSAGTPVTKRVVDFVRPILEKGLDVLMLSARRGSALRIGCENCGWHPVCARCGMSLSTTNLSAGSTVVCRGCGLKSARPRKCEDCGDLNLKELGFGSERIADEMSAATGFAAVSVSESNNQTKFPQPCVFVGSRAAINALPRKPAGLVIGDADQFLSVPDVRASERSLQLFEDALAACEADCAVLVQTRQAGHHVVQSFVRGQYSHFAEHELLLRERGCYPPFVELASIVFPTSVESRVIEALSDAQAAFVGPYPADANRSRLLLKFNSNLPLAEALLRVASIHSEVRIDVDPYDVG